MLCIACSDVCHRLVRHVDLHLSLRILCKGVEKLLQELLSHNHRKHETVEEVVAVDVSKRRADDHAHAITGNSPCGMLA